MATVLERLEALATEKRAGVWTDSEQPEPDALPYLLAVARVVRELPTAAPTNLREWEAAVSKFNNARVALAPLLREVQS